MQVQVNEIELEIKKNKVTVFKVIGDREYIAGAAAGSIYILRKLNENNDDVYTFEVKDNISDFRVINSLHRSFIQTCSNDQESCIYFGSFMKKDYGVWIESLPSRGSTYSLYNFSTPEFLKGIDEICRYFSVDYTSIVFDAPFNKFGQYIPTDYYFQAGLIYSIYIEDVETDIDEAGDENIQDPYSGFDDYENYNE